MFLNSLQTLNTVKNKNPNTQSLSKELCDSWKNQKNVNPLTKEKISRNGSEYFKLTQECSSLGKLSNSEPEYLADTWNHPHTVDRFNCYDYAFNNRNVYQTKKTQPGEISDRYEPKKNQVHQCNWVEDMVRSDHPDIYPIDFETACRPGYYKIATITDNSGEDQDYHFLRQDPNGLWSHKPGAKPVTRLDAKERIITNPSEADYDYVRYSYNNFCGFSCIPENSSERFKKKKNNVITESQRLQFKQQQQKGGSRKSQSPGRIRNAKSPRKAQKKPKSKSKSSATKKKSTGTGKAKTQVNQNQKKATRVTKATGSPKKRGVKKISPNRKRKSPARKN